MNELDRALENDEYDRALDRALEEWRTAEGDRQRRLANIKTLWLAGKKRRHGTWEKFCSIELKLFRTQVARIINGTDLGNRNRNKESSGAPDVTNGQDRSADLSEEDYDPTPLGWDDEMERRKNVEMVKKYLSKCSDRERAYLWDVILPQYYPEFLRPERKYNVAQERPQKRSPRAAVISNTKDQNRHGTLH